MGPQHCSDFFECHQIDYMNVNLLCNGWWLKGIIDHITSWPGTTVYIQVPVLGTRCAHDTLLVQLVQLSV